MFTQQIKFTESSREQLLQKAYHLAADYERKYMGCAQCLIASMQDILGVEESVFKAASLLVGGVCATTEGPCGAYLGGLMVLGWLFGRDREKFDQFLNIFQYVGKLGLKYRKQFYNKYGSCVCKDIQSSIFGRFYKLLDPEEFKEFELAGGHTDKCPSVIGLAATWLIEIIFDELSKRECAV